MTRGHAWQRGRAWQGACVARGCVAGGMRGKGGGLHAGETATEAGSTHPTGMHSCLTCQ